MGADHYLERPDELPPDRFTAWARDVQKVIAALPPALIRGGYSIDAPIITDDLVHFGGNPNYNAGFEHDALAIYADPVRLAAYRVAPSHNGSDGAAAPLHVARVFDQPFRSENDRGWLWDSFPTGGLPYDIAVVAALILFAHHFARMCRVHSEYPYRDWKPGLALARRVTGLPLVIPWFERGWERARVLPVESFCAWRDDVTRVITTAGVPLAGPDGVGEPILSDALVAFNGIGDAGCEPFRFSREYDPADGCWGIGPAGYHVLSAQWLGGKIETDGNRGKPYDLVVAAALVLLDIHFSLAVNWRQSVVMPVAAARATSGGLGEEDWLPGIRLASEAMGWRTFHVPEVWW